MMVTNFPSKIAALQFEWAWQHPLRTRHIDPDVRGEPSSRKRFHLRSAKQCVPYLHMLLTNSTFARWPLHIRFFAEDVYMEWQNYQIQRQKATPLCMSTHLVSNDARMFPRPRRSKKAREPSPQPQGDLSMNESQSSIDELDVTYNVLKPHVQKTWNRSTTAECFCAVCAGALSEASTRALTCPATDCDMRAHLTCLCSRFLQMEGNTAAIIPIKGSCPECGKELSWIELAKDLSLRMRGTAHIKKLLRTPSSKKHGRDAVNGSEADQGDNGSSEDESLVSIGCIDSEAGEGSPNDAVVSSGNEFPAASMIATRSQPPLPYTKGSARLAYTGRTCAVANSDPDDIEAFSE